MRRYKLEVRGREFVVDVNELAPDRFEVVVGDESYEVSLAGDENLPEATITPDFHPSRTAGAAGEAATAKPVASVPSRTMPSGTVRVGASTLTAPMPGVIAEIGVKPGDTVARGQLVVILEAMKMMNSIKSPREGTVAEVCVAAGQAVGHGDPIIRFEEQ